MSMRTVLVTGGNGYLGSVLVEELSVRGYRTIVFDNCLTSLDLPPGLNGAIIEHIRGDVRDPGDLVPVLKELGQLIAQEVPSARLHLVPEKVDKRSYRINFGRIQQALNFRCKYRVIDGIREILAAVRADLYHDFALPKYGNCMMILNHSQQTTELITL